MNPTIVSTPFKELLQKSVRRRLNNVMSAVKRNNRQFLKPFLTAVSVTEFPHYLEVVRHPIDLGIIQDKITGDAYFNSVFKDFQREKRREREKIAKEKGKDRDTELEKYVIDSKGHSS